MHIHRHTSVPQACLSDMSRSGDCSGSQVLRGCGVRSDEGCQCVNNDGESVGLKGMRGLGCVVLTVADKSAGGLEKVPIIKVLISLFLLFNRSCRLFRANRPSSYLKLHPRVEDRGRNSFTRGSRLYISSFEWCSDASPYIPGDPSQKPLAPFIRNTIEKNPLPSVEPRAHF